MEPFGPLSTPTWTIVWYKRHEGGGGVNRVSQSKVVYGYTTGDSSVGGEGGRGGDGGRGAEGGSVNNGKEWREDGG
jgi:hypothetical protein